VRQDDKTRPSHLKTGRINLPQRCIVRRFIESIFHRRNQMKRFARLVSISDFAPRLGLENRPHFEVQFRDRVHGSSTHNWPLQVTGIPMTKIRAWGGSLSFQLVRNSRQRGLHNSAVRATGLLLQGGEFPCFRFVAPPPSTRIFCGGAEFALELIRHLRCSAKRAGIDLGLDMIRAAGA